MKKKRLNYRRLALVGVIALFVIVGAVLIFRKNTKPKQDPLPDVNELLAELDLSSLSLENQSQIEKIRVVQNQLDSDPPMALLQAETTLETLKKQQHTLPRYQGIDQTTVLALNRLLQSYDFEVSVYLRFLDDGSTYLYEPYTQYYPASIIKAALALYLFQEDEADRIRLDETDIAAISNMIMYSDNPSTTFLNQKYGLRRYSTDDAHCEDFATFLQKIGVTHDDDLYFSSDGMIAGQIDAVDMGHIMVALYEYFATASPNSQQLLEIFFDHDHSTDLLTLYEPVVRKYGQFDSALHDAVLGYVPRPYVLCVLTDAGNSEVLEDPDGIMDSISSFMKENFLILPQINEDE